MKTCWTGILKCIPLYFVLLFTELSFIVPFFNESKLEIIREFGRPIYYTALPNTHIFNITLLFKNNVTYLSLVKYHSLYYTVLKYYVSEIVFANKFKSTNQSDRKLWQEKWIKTVPSTNKFEDCWHS